MTTARPTLEECPHCAHHPGATLGLLQKIRELEADRDRKTAELIRLERRNRELEERIQTCREVLR